MKKLTIGDSVKIIKCVKESYHKYFDLTDWQGRIKKIYYDECWDCGHKKKYVSIDFDSITLRQIPDEYILAKIEGGFDFADSEILVKDVVPVSPRDTDEETTAVRIELNKKYNWNP